MLSQPCLGVSTSCGLSLFPLYKASTRRAGAVFLVVLHVSHAAFALPCLSPQLQPDISPLPSYSLVAEFESTKRGQLLYKEFTIIRISATKKKKKKKKKK